MTVTNAGAVPLAVGGLAFEGADADDFLVGSTDCVPVLASGATRSVQVRFVPRAAGAAGAPGPQGPAGAAGPQGPSGPAGRDARLVLVVYRAAASKRSGKLPVRYALTGRADVTLKVRPPKGKTVTVAKARGKAGINTISWNGKLKGKKARKGTYRLTVTAKAGGRTRSTTMKVKLRWRRSRYRAQPLESPP